MGLTKGSLEEASALVAVRVLIPSGAGAPGFAGIVKCLREIPSVYIVGGDSKEFVYGKSLSDSFVTMPSSDLENAYVEAVISVCKSHGIDVVLPITTRELLVLARHRVRIKTETGSSIVVSDEVALLTANHKGRLYEFAWTHGFRVPAFSIVRDKESFGREAEILGVSFRDLCFKPVMGNGSRGFGRVLSDSGYSTDWIQEKAGVLPLRKEEWLERLPLEFTEGEELLLSVYLTGMEYSVDMLCDRGRVIYCIPRSRDKMIGGISVAGTFLNHEPLISECCRLAELLGLDGPIGMQWREDTNGDCYLLEINPRLQGTTSVLLLAGLNLPVEAIRLVLGRSDGTTFRDTKDGYVVNKGLDFGWGRSFVRFWEETLLFDH